MNEYIRLLEIVKNRMEIREDSFGSVIAAKIHNNEEFDLMMSFWTAAYSSCYKREKINGTYVGEDWYFVESDTIDYGMDGKSTTYFTQTLSDKKRKFLEFYRKFDATTVDEVTLKAEAEKQGYHLIRKEKYISLKKCPKCGIKPSLWTGADEYTYRCDGCGLSGERQKSMKKAKLSWNEVAE